VEQHELRPARGATRPRKRVGRGNASGKGTYAGKGLKGQQARAGSGPHPGFEGGQTPLIRRLPVRRGFRNPFRVEYAPVNLSALAKLPAATEITPEFLVQEGLVRTAKRPIKVLADGDVTVALTVRAHRVSAAARAKIEAAGGTVEELTPRKAPEDRRKRGKAKAPARTAGETEAPEAEAAEGAEEADGNDSETSEG
jgi:large subunit ribosomal protein L15